MANYFISQLFCTSLDRASRFSEVIYKYTHVILYMASVFSLLDAPNLASMKFK